MRSTLIALLATAGLAAAQVVHTATGVHAVEKARATARTDSPISNVPGLAFDRIAIIMLETTAYANAIADKNCKALIKQGILLTQNFGIGAPSQPAYVSSASGDHFGTNSDSFLVVNSNVSTIVDLLDDKGISWGNYNEGLPYTGFDGFLNHNDRDGDVYEGNYERKHNLLMRFNSVTLNPDRVSKVKNFTLFRNDLANEKLPQWMFLTPNLFNDGHDTNISVSCKFTRNFVEPLLANPYFNKNTLVYVTWQADGQEPTARNHVAGILLGSAIPAELVGTQDTGYYNHYSQLSSVQANWGLHTLGRWDVGANVWGFVRQKTGDILRTWNSDVSGDFTSYYWNQSYGGVFSSDNKSSHVFVSPNTKLTSPPNSAGGFRTVLPAIASLWSRAKCKASGTCLPIYYKNIIEVPDNFHPPKGFGVKIPESPAMPIMTPITAYPH